MGASLWIVWAVIGIIGGFMVGRLVPGVRSVFLSVCVGIAGAVLGGWLFVLLFGVSERMESLSLAVSAVVCALFLWAFSCITGKDNTGEC